jgi:hypothetical protein
MMLASIVEREQFRGLLVAKIQNIPHIRSNSLEKSTSFNAIELRSIVFTLGKAQIYSALHSLNQTIRHKSVLFIPNVWLSRKLCVILHLQNN